MNFGKLNLQIILFLFSVCLYGCSAPLPGKILVGYESPTFRMYRLEDGSPVTIRTYPGQRKVILFWNTQCGASRRAMAKLDTIAQQFINRKDTSTVFIAANLNSSNDLSKVKEEIIESDAFSLEHMMSGNEEYDEAYLNAKGDSLPHVVVIEKDGTVSHVEDNLDFLG
jgi:hypothetical protein